MAELLVAATARSAAADFVATLTGLYTLLILVAVLISIVQSIGWQIPYSRPLRAVLDFVDSLTEPVLSWFRRVVPPIGPLDLSPMVAVIAIGVAGWLIAGLIAG